MAIETPHGAACAIDAAAIPPAVPGNNLIQSTTVDTLGLVESVLMFCSNSMGRKGGESKSADIGLALILDCCRDAVMYETAKMQAEGRL